MLKEKTESIKTFFSGIELDDESHIYTVNDKEVNISASGIVSKYYNKFEFEIISYNYAKKHNLDLDELRKSWIDNGIEAANRGTITHNFSENYYFDSSVKTVLKKDIAAKKFIDYIKSKFDKVQIVFTELKMYHKKYGFCGTADLVLYADGKFIIADYKTNKQLENWYGLYLKKPFSELRDTNLSRYTIQLNIYQIMLEQVFGVEVSDRLIISLIGEEDDNDSIPNYRIIPVKDISKKLKIDLDEKHKALHTGA